jgi:uncharacterized membrane protein
VAALVAVTAVTVGIGIGARMATRRPFITDLPMLYRARGIHPDATPYLDRPLEYPVLVGAAFYGATFVASSPRSFFLVTAVGTGLLALIGAYALARFAGRRAWYWALAPPLAMYGSLNWDLLAIVPAIVGTIAFVAGADLAAGVLLGLGGAAKVYPALFLPVFAVARLRDRDRRGALRLLGGAIGTVAVVNVPVLLASPSGWWYPLHFQARRAATWGSLAHYVLAPPGIGPWTNAATERSLANAGALAGVLVGIVVASVLVWRRRLDPIAGAGAATVAFLVTNKIYSPQYDLWFVPFLVLLVVPWRHVVAFFAVDAAVFALVFGRLGHHYRWTVVWAWCLGALVVARTLVMIWSIRDATPVRAPVVPESRTLPVREAEASAA